MKVLKIGGFTTAGVDSKICRFWIMSIQCNTAAVKNMKATSTILVIGNFFTFILSRAMDDAALKLFCA